MAGPAPPQVTWLLSKTALDSGREELPVINGRRPSPALPFLSPPWGADGRSEASALWEGKPAKQAEFPEKAGGPGTWPLVPRNRAFSGLQEVTSLSLCTGNVCVPVSLFFPRRVPLTCGGIDYYYANNGPGLQHAGLGPLSPRGGSPSAQGGSDGPGLRPATWTHQIGRVCRLPVLAACLPPLSLLQLLWKAPALGAPGQSTGQGPAAAQVLRRKGLGPIAPHPGTQGLIPFSVPALPLYPRPLNPRPTGILKHPE